MKKRKQNILVLLGIIVLVALFVSVALIRNYEKITTNKLAFVGVKGGITLYDSSGLFSSGGTSAESIISKLEKAEDDPLVKAVILEINSGGGTVVASKEVARKVEEIDKPTVAWIREKGGSGAYWIASAADVIVADEASMTGSIGVRGSYLEFSELFKEYGVDYQRLVSGKYKDLGSPYKNLTEEEYEVLIEKINIIENQFLEDIKENRNLTEEAIDKISTAEVFLGIEAEELGLVDKLGSKEEVVDSAEELANISSSKEIHYTKEKSLFEKLAGVLVKSSYFMGEGIGSSLFKMENQEVLVAK